MAHRRSAHPLFLDRPTNLNILFMYPPIGPLLTILGPPSCIGCPGTPLPRSSVLPCASRRCTTLFLARAAPTFRPMRPARPPAFFAGGAAESDIYKQQHCDCLAVARASQEADFLPRVSFTVQNIRIVQHHLEPAGETRTLPAFASSKVCIRRRRDTWRGAVGREAL